MSLAHRNLHFFFLFSFIFFSFFSEMWNTLQIIYQLFEETKRSVKFTSLKHFYFLNACTFELSKDQMNFVAVAWSVQVWSSLFSLGYFSSSTSQCVHFILSILRPFFCVCSSDMIGIQFCFNTDLFTVYPLLLLLWKFICWQPVLLLFAFDAMLLICMLFLMKRMYYVLVELTKS